MLEDSRLEGERRGKLKGMDHTWKVVAALMDAGRTEDIHRAGQDKKYQKQLMEEFGII